MRVPLLFAVLLVIWGNAVSSAFGPMATLPGGSLEFAIAGVALSALALAVAQSRGVGLLALVGSRRDALVGAAIGAAGAAVVALGAVLFLRAVAPLITGAPVEYAPLSRATAERLAWHTAVLLPLGVVAPEEFAFRGTLLALTLRTLTFRWAIALSASAFALWHGSVILATVKDTTFAPPSPWFALACVAALAVVFVGGALFALLRLRTRTILTTMTAHWLFNALLLYGLWLSQPGA